MPRRLTPAEQAPHARRWRLRPDGAVRQDRPEIAAARETIAAAFPGREVVPADASTLGFAGGGIHGIPQRRPKA
ncbi:MAG: hypothetical protein AAGI51_05135 [Pseudomonadota bacterium]